MNCLRSQAVSISIAILFISTTGAWLLLIAKSRSSSVFPCNFKSSAASVAMPLSGLWTSDRRRWILFGDSLTERSLGFGGWGSSIAHQYYRRVDIVNRGDCHGHAGPCLSVTPCDHLLPCIHGSCDPTDTMSYGISSRTLQGFSGYNSRWAMHLVNDVFSGRDGKAELVTLFWGANDAARPLPLGNE